MILAYLFNISFIRRNYLKFHAITLGEGDSLVFLHGWGQNLNMMMPIAHPLSKKYRCLVLDLFGFGESDELEDYHLNSYVEQLHEHFELNQIKNPVLIAHSFGARIAILYANHYPCRALILTGAAGIKSPLTLDKQIKQFLHRHRIIKSKGSIDYQQASPFLKRVLVEAIHLDLSEICTQITIPVLLVWGEKDNETPLWMGEKMKDLFVNSTWITFAGQGHFAYFYEHDRFAHICMKYLEGVL